MRRRSWKKLAGCIAIELGLAALAAAADYQAGAASAGTAHALVLRDARGNKMVFAQAEFRITQTVADQVAVQVIKDYDVDRPGILLRWSGIGNRPAQPDDLLAAIGQALAAMEPAVVRYAHRGLSIMTEEFERCVASVSPDGNLGSEGCWNDGTVISGGIRAAFQMVEPVHGLQRRGESVQSYPVQAIGLGKVVTILALSGEAAIPEGVNSRRLIFARFANESAAAPKDAHIYAAVQRVLARTQ
jgi:hypothetical protein